LWREGLLEKRRAWSREILHKGGHGQQSQPRMKLRQRLTDIPEGMKKGEVEKRNRIYREVAGNIIKKSTQARD